MTETVLPKDIPIPTNSDELTEFFADGGRYKDLPQNRKAFEEFTRAYGQKMQGDGTDLNRQIDEQVQRQLRNLLIENEVDSEGQERIQRLNLNPQANVNGNMLTTHRQGAAHNPQAPGAVLDKAFPSHVDYVRAIWHKNPHPDEEKLTALRNAASSVSPSDGGALVPENLRAQLLQIALEMSVVRPLATVVPMDSARVPFPVIDSTSNESSVFGGMIAYWTEEAAMLQDSSPKFGRVVLDAKKLTGLSAVPNELLQDSIVSFSALIESLWPRALAFEEDRKFMTGDGAGEPAGFMGANNPAAVEVAKESGQPADTIVYENLVNMYARMLPASLNRAVWLASPKTLRELLTMALSVGTGGNSVFVVNASESVPMSIFGRPLKVTEKAGALGDRGDISFVDLSYYLVGDRQTMTADSSTDYNFGSDKTTFRIIQRVDGRPWLLSPITPANGDDSLSPFVELAARA